MPTTPNPATTEWVPLWDLNGSTSGGGSSDLVTHHLTHELGGTDVIQNVAWTNQANTFIQNQLVSKARPELQVQNTGNTSKTRLLSATSYDGELTNNLSYDAGGNWNRDDVTHGGNILSIYDGQFFFYRAAAGANPAALTLSAQLDNSGILTVSAGLGSTPLSASQITSGTIPDARLSVNVLKHPGGYPGGTSTYLRADGTFSTPNVGVPAPHHVTHEPGGGDQIQNVAWTNLSNIFLQNQRIVSSGPMWEVKAVGNATTARMGQVVPNNRLDIMSNLFHDGTNWMADDVSQPSVLYIQQIGEHDFYTCGIVPNPRGASLAKQVSITSTGTTITAGLVNTPLNASDLSSGTIPDARLSSNVALKNIDNQFIPQTLASTSIIKGTGAYLGWYDTAASVADTHNWRMLGYGDGTFWLEALNDANNVYQARFGFGRNNELYGALLDASSLNRGTVPLARLPAGIGGLTQTSGTWLVTIGGVPDENGNPSNAGESGQGYDIRHGYFVKTGKLVNLWSQTQFGNPAANSEGNGGTGYGKGVIVGDLAVKGFPFPVATVPCLFAGVNSYYSDMLTPSSKLTMTFHAGGTFTYGRIKQTYQNNNPLPLHDIDVNNDTQFVFAISYFTDS